MAYYTDQFYYIDPYSPPAAGSTMNPTQLTIQDRNGDSVIDTSHRDTINGVRVSSVYNGDQVTVMNGGGQQITITGVTFYLADGTKVFTPADGTKLHDATFVSSSWVPNSTQMNISQLGPPCFIAGTRIRTADGARPVERLRVGDRVETRDHGPQVVRWTGARTVPGTGCFAPIRFAPGAVGNDRPLLVSPQHRILLTGWRAELLFGEDEVLAAAKHLVNGTTIRPAPVAAVTYVHLMFDRHEIVTAEGAPSESFHPGDFILAGDGELRAEILGLFPELAGRMPARSWETARTVLKAHEAQLMAQAA